MIGEPHYYKGKTHYDKVEEGPHCWRHRFKKRLHGYLYSTNAWWLQLRDMRNSKYIDEQYIIMQEIGPLAQSGTAEGLRPSVVAHPQFKSGTGH